MQKNWRHAQNIVVQVRKFLFKTDFYDDLAGFNYFLPPINICSLLKQFSPFETRRLPSPPTLCGLKVAQIKSNIPTKTLLFKPTVIVFSSDILI